MTTCTKNPIGSNALWDGLDIFWQLWFHYNRPTFQTLPDIKTASSTCVPNIKTCLHSFKNKNRKNNHQVKCMGKLVKIITNKPKKMSHRYVRHDKMTDTKFIEVQIVTWRLFMCLLSIVVLNTKFYRQQLYHIRPKYLCFIFVWHLFSTVEYFWHILRVEARLEVSYIWHSPFKGTF